MIGEGALQYGGLGLAAIVIGLVALYIRERDKREAESRAKADERKAAADQFIQDLVARSLVVTTESEAAWREMVQKDIAAQERMVQALDKLCERMTAAEVQHAQILVGLQTCRESSQ